MKGFLYVNDPQVEVPSLFSELGGGLTMSRKDSTYSIVEHKNCVC